MGKVFYLICGYKNSGKNTLYKHLIGDTTFSWRILRYRTLETEHLIDRDKVPNLVRARLSDIIKAYTHKTFKIPLFNHEQYKGIKLSEVEKIIKFSLPQTLNKDLTLSDYYTLISLQHTAQDINYWCKQLYEHISDEPYVIITDFRHKHEYEFFKNLGTCITIRVFRKEILPPSEHKQHDLDDFKTDLVYIPATDSEEHLAALLQRFPQYQ